MPLASLAAQKACHGVRAVTQALGGFLQSFFFRVGCDVPGQRRIIQDDRKPWAGEKARGFGDIPHGDQPRACFVLSCPRLARLIIRRQPPKYSKSKSRCIQLLITARRKGNALPLDLAGIANWKWAFFFTLPAVFSNDISLRNPEVFQTPKAIPASIQIEPTIIAGRLRFSQSARQITKPRTGGDQEPQLLLLSAPRNI